MNPQHMTVNEAADRLGISTRTVRRFFASGKLKGVRISERILRIDPDSVAALLQGEGAAK